MAQAPEGSPVPERENSHFRRPRGWSVWKTLKLQTRATPSWLLHAPEGTRSCTSARLPVKGTQRSSFLPKASKDFRPHPTWRATERVEFRECGAEDHWEGVEPPLPKFRSHQDWIMRVQLALCRICVAVPALFGRGSPFREGEGKSEPHSGVPRQVPTTSLLCTGRSETREDACAGTLSETAQPEI